MKLLLIGLAVWCAPSALVLLRVWWLNRTDTSLTWEDVMDR